MHILILKFSFSEFLLSQKNHKKQKTPACKEIKPRRSMIIDILFAVAKNFGISPMGIYLFYGILLQLLKKMN